MPQIQDRGDAIEGSRDADPQKAGDLSGHELADEGSAVRAAPDQALRPLDQRGLVDPVQVAHGGDGEALGDLARPDLRLGVIEGGRGVRGGCPNQLSHVSNATGRH